MAKSDTATCAALGVQWVTSSIQESYEQLHAGAPVEKVNMPTFTANCKLLLSKSVLVEAVSRMVIHQFRWNLLYPNLEAVSLFSSDSVLGTIFVGKQSKCGLVSSLDHETSLSLVQHEDLMLEP